MPPTKHGFKKESSKASPSKPPKVYDDYVYDIGTRLTGSDLDNRIDRFEATYSMKSLATTVGINDYVYDIGDRLTGSDLDNRFDRFEATSVNTYVLRPAKYDNHISHQD